MILRTESEAVFACYSKACAPPPAGRGGSISGMRAGITYQDKALGRVTVEKVTARDNDHDEVTVSGPGGRRAVILVGPGGIGSRKKAATPKRDDPDGYDRKKDAIVSKYGSGGAKSTRAWKNR